MKFEREKIEENTYRARIPAGWLVRTVDIQHVESNFSTQLHNALVFVSDPTWSWNTRNTE